jgi:DNA-binding winged helix-turn-helix (wHTH) protein/Tol biopolymer transport system component
MSLDLSSSFHQFRISVTGNSKNGIFVFDQFRLDAEKLMLYREGEEVLIPAKVAKTLAVLVENAGSILSKDEFIDRVWEDSIVEESNLTQYLYLLRKTLGTMPDGRPYIETLRRRGYRFNGEVRRDQPLPGPVFQEAVNSAPAAHAGGVQREGNVLRVVDWRPSEEIAEPVELASETETVSAAETAPARASSAPASSPTTSHVRRFIVAAAALILACAGGALLWPYVIPAASVAESQKELEVIRLTNGSNPVGATISPDGNFFVYSENEGEVSRMFLQQTGQSSRIELEKLTGKLFGAKAVFPDQQSLLYVAFDPKTSIASAYRIPTMGGASVKVVDDVYGAVSISPDGKEIAFVRRNAKANDTSLIVAASDGRAERILLQRKGPTLLSTSSPWSPDGKLILFGEVDVSDKGGRGATNSLYTIDVATGRTAPFSQEKWANVLLMTWFPDASGIVLIGTRADDSYSTRRDQVYFVSYPDGISRRVTNDGNRHDPDSLSVTRNGEILAVPATRSAQVWTLNADGNATGAVQRTRGLADGRAGLAGLPNGRFSYLARTADEINIMVSDADGARVRQLATGFEYVEELRADPLGRFLILSTVKDNKNHLFRLDTEGGGVRQLTEGDTSEIDSTVSPDGKYVAYDSASIVDGAPNFAIKRVPAEGGDPVTIRSKGCFIPTYSPDGSMLTCIRSDKPEIEIISASDGSLIQAFKIPVASEWNFGIGWTADGSGLVYIVTENGISNLEVQPRDGGKPRRLTNFTSGSIYRYAFSPDSSKLYLSRGYPTKDVILIRNFH